MRFLVKLLKHWYLYLIPVLILPVAGALYGKQKLSVYETSALLYVYSSDTVTGTNTNFNTFVSPAQNGSDLLNQLMQSNTFVVTVASKTELRYQYDLGSRGDQDIAVGRIRGDVFIAPTGIGINNVTLTVNDKSPTLVLHIAQALIAASSHYLQIQRLAYDQHAETFLTQQIDLARVRLAKDSKALSDYVNAHPNVASPNNKAPDPQYQNLSSLVSADEAAYKNLTDRISAVRLDEDAQTTGQSDIFAVFDDPQPPLRPTLHLKGLIPYAGGGLALALGLILLIVGAQTLLDRKVYSTRDLFSITEELELDIPVVTTIPVLALLARSSRQQHDDDVLSGVLVPILTVLPQSSTEVLNHEIRSAAGISVADDD